LSIRRQGGAWPRDYGPGYEPGKQDCSRGALLFDAAGRTPYNLLPTFQAMTKFGTTFAQRRCYLK